ncbi:Protein of unknown function [Christiangramia echinicola]|uniref:Deacetylase PdaC domain-containing protein n=1 Tax=Christiangramia echinicola TaxID=279359 RepID=A0A1H1MQI4_9FLAO|nr:Protein of unknown function [Christiangramia echinicola]
MFAFIAVFLVISCADEKKENEENEIKALSFSSRTIEKRLDDCLPENGECTFISLTYPVAEDGNGEAEKINNEIEDLIVRTIDFQDEGHSEKPEELAENFIRDYKETANDFPEYELPWEATVIGKINYRSPSIVSIKFNTDMFTGGAHGYRSTNYLNFDPESGKTLKESDLFNSDFIDYVEKDFRQKKNIPLDTNINSTGMFFENDEFHLPANIGIKKGEIILHYNAYEIAPYSAGNFILTYPKSEIEQYLKIHEEKTQI